MYLGRNLYDPYARYIDLPDPEFFHAALQSAMELYEKEGGPAEVTADTIDYYKRQKTPVLYGSSVVNLTQDDVYLRRIEIKDRLTMKYLIIDADFNPGEEAESEAFRETCINFSVLHFTPIVIYPSISYPGKPRFRVVFFTKRKLTESSYIQAMGWLTRQLGYTPKDAADMRMTGSNNAPIFINEDQVKGVFDSTQDEDLEPLDNKLWAKEPKPKLPKKLDNAKRTAYDNLEIDPSDIKAGVRNMVEAGRLNTYDDFWKFCMSLARAELFEQLSEDDVKDILEIMTHAAPDETTRLAWKGDNERQYSVNRNRLFRMKQVLASSRPITSYPIIRDTIIGK